MTWSTHVCHILASLVEGLPTLPLFCKAMQIPRNPLEDPDDTVVLYGLWHIESLSNSVVPVWKTS